jgi:ElaB/YqjD/DUF883 family membrane-anchored ribosome-binding protein
MYTNPTPSDLLEGVIVALQSDVLPNVTTQKAAVSVVMMQSIIQQVRQMIPGYLQTLAREHNEMTETLRDMAALLGETPGPEAARVRERASAALSREPFATLPAQEEVMAAHRSLSQDLVACVRDLDIVIREGNASGEDALQRMRAHLGARLMNDFATMTVGAGMAGRG